MSLRVVFAGLMTAHVCPERYRPGKTLLTFVDHFGPKDLERRKSLYVELEAGGSLISFQKMHAE